MVGDACLTVSLAGSIFFTQPARAVPDAGPAVPAADDRPVRGGGRRSSARRSTAAGPGGARSWRSGASAGRAVCFLMVGNLDSLFLFPLAFVRPGPLEGPRGGEVGAAPGGRRRRARAGRGELAALARQRRRERRRRAPGGRVRRAVRRAACSLVFGDDRLRAWPGCCARRSRRRDARRRSRPRRSARSSRAPSIVFAGTAMAVMRGCVGFLTFQLAFILKGTRPAARGSSASCSPRARSAASSA